MLAQPKHLNLLSLPFFLSICYDLRSHFDGVFALSVAAFSLCSQDFIKNHKFLPLLIYVSWLYVQGFCSFSECNEIYWFNETYRCNPKPFPLPQNAFSYILNKVVWGIENPDHCKTSLGLITSVHKHESKGEAKLMNYDDFFFQMRIFFRNYMLFVLVFTVCLKAHKNKRAKRCLFIWISVQCNHLRLLFAKRDNGKTLKSFNIVQPWNCVYEKKHQKSFPLPPSQEFYISKGSFIQQLNSRLGLPENKLRSPTELWCLFINMTIRFMGRCKLLCASLFELADGK